MVNTYVRRSRIEIFRIRPKELLPCSSSPLSFQLHPIASPCLTATRCAPVARKVFSGIQFCFITSDWSRFPGRDILNLLRITLLLDASFCAAWLAAQVMTETCPSNVKYLARILSHACCCSCPRILDHQARRQVFRLLSRHRDI